MMITQIAAPNIITAKQKYFADDDLIDKRMIFVFCFSVAFAIYDVSSNDTQDALGMHAKHISR